MSIKTLALGFDSLADLDDGRVNALLKHHLKRIAEDCISRPNDATTRKVVLEFNVKPVANQEGDIDFVRVNIEARSKIPIYRTRPYEMRCVKGGFLFNADFPDSVDQQDMFPETKNEPKKEGEQS